MRKIFTVSLLATIISSGYAQTGGTWVKKADISATPRESAVGFAINSKGYIGLGNGGGAPNGTMWECDYTTNVWTQKASMTGGGRVNPVAFVLSGNAYIGTGENVSFAKDKKFYQYNPSTNTWTAKTDFGGTARTEAVGFAIGTKGYVGTGDDGTRRKDFWEYDATANTWTQKADFGGTARSRAVGFSIGTKGYIGTGNDGALKKDFWEYDQTSNVWTKKADFAGAARESAVAFALSGKGYIATGDTGSGKADIWEYNPSTDDWVQRANFTGQRRYVAAGFASSYTGKAYIGTGFTDEPSVGVSTKDFYEFTPPVPPAAPTNAMVTSYSETSIRLHWLDNSADESTFSIERSLNGTTFAEIAVAPSNSITYTDNGLTTGQTYYYRVRATKASDGSSSASNVASQAPAKNENGVWTLVNDNYSQNPSFADNTSTFTINNIIYLTAIGDNSGNVTANSKNCWAYDPASNTFTQKATFGGEARTKAAAFVLNGKGYVGTGYKGPANTDCLKDLWQYDPASNQWTQKADVGTTGRSNSIAFTIGGKAYAGTGYLSTGVAGKDFYEYDPGLDTWTPKADFPFITSSSYGAAANNKGYAIYTGTSPISLYEYDPVANTWTGKPSYPIKTDGFRGLVTIQNRLYGSMYTGSGPTQSTLWEYEPANARWIERAPQSTESQYYEANTATTNDKLFYFTQSSLHVYNPSFGVKTPIALTADVIDPIKVKLNWIVDPAASKTQIYRAENEAGPFQMIAELSSDKLTYIDEFDGVSAAAYYKVRAINSTSQSDYTPTVLATKTGAWKQLKKIPNESYVSGDVSVATSSRGYVGITTNSKTWWEYNPENDSWTQKSDFPGESRTSASYFSLNDQVYVGLGSTYDYTSNKYILYKDFWQYSPADNSWTQKKEFPGTPRISTGITTGDGHAFIVGGDDNAGTATFLNEVWAYDPLDDSWVELPKIPVGVAFASTMMKDNSLWVMNGAVKTSTSSWSSVRQAYRLNMVTLTWFKEPNPAYYFSGQTYLIDNTAYVSVTSMIAYDFSSKKWSLKPAVPYSNSSYYYSPRTFSMQGKIYAVTGNNEVWSFSPDGLVAGPEKLTSQFLGDRIALSWQNPSSVPVKTKLQYSNTSNGTYTDLAVVDEGATQYVFSALTPDLNYRFRAVALNSDLEQSVPSNLTFENAGPYWTELADVSGVRRIEAISFSSNGKLYYGTGSYNNVFYKDLWEFDPANGVWTQKSDVPGEERGMATTFTLGNDVYVGLGKNKGGNSLKDLWKYSSTTNTWIASADYANGIKLNGPGVFVADGKAYLIGGEQNSNSSTNELWRFDGTTWVQLTSLPGNTRRNPITFTLNGKAYVGSGIKSLNGTTNYGAKDFWEYTISNDSWKQLKDLPQELVADTRSFSATGGNNAIVFSSPNGNGQGILPRMYWPEQDKWTAPGNGLHNDYMYNSYTMTQDPVTGFSYAIVTHSDFGVKLWRYEYLLNGPNLVEARLAAPGSARLKWRKMSPQADSVVIYRSETSNAIGARIGAVKNSDTTSVNAVSNGKTYYYRIRAYSNSGQYKTSSERMLVVDNPPSAPINLTGELTSINIGLKWQSGTGAAATSYVIERAVNSETDFKELGTANSLSFTTADFAAAKMSYRVKAVNASGSSPYSNIVVMLVTGIEKEESTVSVYPNPTTDYVVVKIDGNTGPVNVELLDASGRKFFSNELNATGRIDMTPYHTGIYFVHLSGGNQKLNKFIKVVKK